MSKAFYYCCSVCTAEVCHRKDAVIWRCPILRLFGKKERVRHMRAHRGFEEARNLRRQVH